MRILHVISSLRAALGGPTEVVRSLSAVLVEQGHNVEAVTLDAPADQEIQRFPVPVHSLGPARGSYAWSPALLPWLRRERSRFDAVLVHGLWQYPGFAVWRALAGTATPYLVFPHGMLDPWFRRRYPLKHLKKWLYWPWGEYRVLRDARAVLFTCEEESRLAPQSFALYRANSVVTGLGTTTPPAGDAEAFFARFPALRGQRLLLFMGRLHPKKGCDLLLEAYASVIGTSPEWRLVFAGPDDVGYQRELFHIAEQRGIADRVICTGLLRDEAKWGAFAAAEVFALPSHQENFGIAVAESLACGLPVLISNAVNIWREVDAAHAGFVEPDTREGTVRLLERWLALSPEERAAMRRNSRQCFAENFHIEQSVARLLDVLAAPAAVAAR